MSSGPSSVGVLYRFNETKCPIEDKAFPFDLNKEYFSNER